MEQKNFLQAGTVSRPLSEFQKLRNSESAADYR